MGLWHGIEKFLDTGSAPVAAALTRLLRAGTLVATTVCFCEPLSTAVELYDQYLKAREAEEYDHHMVAMLGMYLAIRHSAKICGFDVTHAPLPTVARMELIYNHLMLQERVRQALRIATNYASVAPPENQTKLLDDILSRNKLNNLVKAEALATLSSIHYEDKRQKDAMSELEAAMVLYRNAGHITAPLTLEVQQYGMDLPRTHRGRSARQRKRVRERLTNIKLELERLKDFEGVRKASMVLYTIAQLENDDLLRIELDREMERIAEVTGNVAGWIMLVSIMVQQWDVASPSTGQMLASVEAIYRRAEDMEAPMVLANLVATLSNGYQKLGDTEKAQRWATKAMGKHSLIPNRSRFLQNLDGFYRSLEQTTTAPLNTEAEQERLLAELDRVVEDVDVETTPNADRYMGIMKVTNMAELYMNQFQLRGFARTKMLVDTCMSYSDRLLGILPRADAQLWHGKAMQVYARLEFIRANAFPKADPKTIHDTVDTEALLESLKLYEKAAEVYRQVGQTFHHAAVQQQIGTCRQLMWSLDNKSPTSPSFGRVVDSYEAAGKLFARQGSLESLHLNRSFLLRHWFNGYASQVQYGRPRPLWRYLGLGWLSRVLQWLGVWKRIELPQWLQDRRHLFFTTPYEETIKYLAEVEMINNQKRQDLSALNSKDAILSKQNMRRDQYVSLVYQIAPVLFGVTGQNKHLWDWVQRSKARSVSDLLGLGISIPTELRIKIASDPVTAGLLSKEETLMSKVNSVPVHAQLFARKELEVHRTSMRKHDSLRELLELREGHPVSWERLRRLRHIAGDDSAQMKTWFVDWLVCNGLIFAIAVSDEKEEYHVVRAGMDLAEAVEWTKENLDQHEALNEEEESLVALVKLSKLVAPLLDITSEGDFLVMCMTDALHRLPLHAAIIKGDPEEDVRKCQTLMERNMTTYTSSMTVFEQNALRALRRPRDHVTGHSTLSYKGTVLGVYEHATLGKWEAERDAIYDMCRRLAEEMEWGEATCGADVDRSKFQEACKCDIVHFSGHFVQSDPNVLKHGILLAVQSPSSSTGVDMTTSSSCVLDAAPAASTGSAGGLSFEQDTVFSVSDMFSSNVSASFFSLIACGSASEAIQQGDEPLGIVTALLCVGASSVAGTLWPINSGAGREFTNLFYKAFKARSRARRTNLALAMRDAVSELRKIEGMEYPYCWASFILHGSWFI